MGERNGYGEFVSAHRVLDTYADHEMAESDMIAATLHGLSGLVLDRMRQERPDLLSGVGTRELKKRQR